MTSGFHRAMMASMVISMAISMTKSKTAVLVLYYAI